MMVLLAGPLLLCHAFAALIREENWQLVETANLDISGPAFSEFPFSVVLMIVLSCNDR
jgi:hypothetical protein